jgi:hypothetical protein
MKKGGKMMMKKVLVFLAGAMMLAAPAMAAEIPQAATQAPAYNCDYEPSCEVSPGVYGKISSPVTSKFNLSIGGYARLDYAYNSQNLGTLGFVLPNGGLFRSGSVQEAQDQSIFTARVSRFWMKVAGPTFLGAKTGSLIEADFVGLTAANNNSNENGELRMRHAYGTLDWPNTQVMFGQFWDIFGPAAASTVDFRQGAAFGTPNNPRVAQVRITQKVNFNSDNFLKLVIGAQNPSQDANNGVGGNVPNVAGQIMFVSKALGVAPGFYGMSMNSLQAGFFGLWGTQTGNASDGLRNTDVYGYGAYAFVPLLKSKDGKSRAMTASLETQAYIASGMNWNGATANTTTATATLPASNLSGGAAAKGYGVYGQIIFYPIQDLGITAGYERRNAINYDALSSSNTASFSFEEYNQLIYANVAYDLNAAVRLSAEYLHAKTQYNTPVTVSGASLGDSGNNNSVRVAAYYFF